MPILQDFIIIDTSQALAELDTVEKERKKTEEAVVKTTETAKVSLKQAIALAQGTWDLTIGVAEAAGMSISLVTKAVVQGAFNIAGTIAQIAAAEAITPALQFQAVLSFIGAGLAIGAAIAAEQKQDEQAALLAQSQTTINRMVSYIGLWDFS